MPDPLNVIGLQTSYVAAGLAGGGVRALLRPSGQRVKTMLTAVAGGPIAAYLTPGIIALGGHFGYWPADAETAQQLALSVGFSVGLAGMTVCETIINAVQRWSRNPTLPPRPGAAIATAPQPKDSVE